jgi:3-oxoacyl-[acyl-carrier-protein] synthase II
MTRRVVITGLGTINAISSDIPTLWSALVAGKSGVGLVEGFDTSAFKVKIGGEVKGFKPETVVDRKTVRHLDRFAQFALVATHYAIQDSRLNMKAEDPTRFGVMVGSGIGGLSEFEEQHSRLEKEGPTRLSPFMIPKMIANSAAGIISIEFGLRGPNTAVSTACASAGNAIGDAYHTIQHGQADAMIAGGAEATITPMGLGGFIAARALSLRNDDPTTASRPFDRERDGFVLSEGAGIVVLEELERARKRGATIYAEVLGSGASGDAYHITAPHPEGIGASVAMRAALRDARLNPEDIQYVNAHGTSTPLGDAAETRAIKAVFGPHAKSLAISSTKSMLGHLLGASGGVELIATVLMIKNRLAHPTINLHTPDPECDLDYIPNKAREMTIRRAISNSFGFGGHNSCLVVGSLA